MFRSVRLNLTRQCVTNRHRARARMLGSTAEVGRRTECQILGITASHEPAQRFHRCRISGTHILDSRPISSSAFPMDRTAEPTARSQLVSEQLYRQGTGPADQGSYVRLQRHPAVIRMMLEGKVDLKPFITCRIELENLVEQGSPPDQP